MTSVWLSALQKRLVIESVRLLTPHFQIPLHATGNNQFVYELEQVTDRRKLYLSRANKMFISVVTNR